MVRSAEELFAIEKMAAQSLGSNKITEALGVVVDNEAVVAEAPLGRGHGAAQHWVITWRGGWFVSLVFAILVSYLSNCQ